MDANILDSNVSVLDTRSAIVENVWRREKVFHFFSHPKMLNLSFPCTTLEGGTDPGKPCAFPFGWDPVPEFVSCERENMQTNI